MRPLATLFIAILIATTAAVAQPPQVAYMFPDIGAQGMNTYVEIIAPFSAFQTFGNQDVEFDGTPGRTALFVRPVTPTQNIVVGPCMVSWEGRMIGTQVFVRPGTPPGSYPLEVVFNGLSSAQIPFQVIVPQPLTFNASAILGNGPAGTANWRSPRGAMIVSSLTLTAGTFTVNRGDIDGPTPGNQGYLPFVLISQRAVTISGSVTISVDATGRDGGPGGGGGGAQICDAPVANPSASQQGSGGGNGFTGGGGGGVNRAPANGSIFQSNGTGTGPSVGSNSTTTTGWSTSLNGTYGGRSCMCNPESAGGGTGHPFGTGGDASTGGPATAAGHGGAGGAAQNFSGAGGNYRAASAGAGGGNAGLMHGDSVGVPLAGGSGGSSGNPQAPAFPFTVVCAGEGGGGGGAIGIFSQERMLALGSVITARGSAGGNGGGESGGGGGSGGLAIIGAKDTLSRGGQALASGGAGGSGSNAGGAGSHGVLRFDGFPRGGFEPTLVDKTDSYIGPTIDTMTYTDKKTFRISGTFDGVANIFVWIHGENGYTNGWTRLAGPGATNTNFGRNSRRWWLDITVPTLGYYYIVAGSEVNLENLDTWKRTPPTVLSQSAANIIYANVIPQINFDTTLVQLRLVCGFSVLDSIPIVNTGSGDLIVQAPTITGTGRASFQIAPGQTFPMTLPGERSTDTVWIKYLFAPTVGGVQTATFDFQNNDMRTDVIAGVPNPRERFLVTVSGRKMLFRPNIAPSPLQLEACFNSDTTGYTEFVWQTGSDSTGAITSIVPMDPEPSITLLSPTILPTTRVSAGGAAIPITFRFRPTAPGMYTRRFLVTVDPCDSQFILTVRGNALQADIRIYRPSTGTISFANVRVNPTPAPSQAIDMKNWGTSTGTIVRVYFTGTGELSALSTTGLIGQRVAPGGIITGGFAIFRPTLPGSLNAMMCVVFDGACPDTVCVPVFAEVITSRLVLSRDTVDLVAEKCADPAPTEEEIVTLTNFGTAPERVTSIAAVKGLVNVSLDRTLPWDLAPDEVITITIRWTPGVTDNDIVRVLSDSKDPSQARMDIGVSMTRDLSKIVVLDSAGVPVQTPISAEYNFGSLFACDLDRSIDFIVRSLGNGDETVGLRFTSGGTAFSVAPPPPQFTLGRGQDRTITVTFSTSLDGVFIDTLVIRNELCLTETRIPLRGSRTGLTYSASDVPFGKSNVGQPVTKVATFTFDSTASNSARIVITDVIIDPLGTPFVITRKLTPTTLAPNENTTADITFTPPAEQAYTARVGWIIDSPCKDTVWGNVSGEGIKSNLQVSGDLNFGTHFFCGDSTLDLTIANTGTAPVQITGVSAVTGVYAAAFVQVTPVSTPVNLLPGGAPLVITYRFVPSAVSFDGLMTATVLITSDDATRDSVVVTLIGERRRQVLQSPVAMDFGTVTVGQFGTQDVFLYNRATVPLTIDRFTISPPYSVDSPTTPVDIPAAPGFITVRVRYTPTDSVQSDARLVAHYSIPCVDSVEVNVTGRGKVILVGQADLVIPDSLKGAPGDRISIPIILVRSALLRESEATTFRSVVRFNKTLLYPTGIRSSNEARPKVVTGAAVSSGAIISSVIEGDDRVVTFEVTNDPMPVAVDTIAFIDATVLLGDRLTTPLTFDALNFTNGQVITLTTNGLFTLVGYCEVGVNRLVRMTGAAGIKTVAPNPFNPSTEIMFETSESGPTTMLVHNASGEVIDRIVDRQALPVGVHTITWNAGDFPSGMYYIEMRTPTERSVHRVVLVK